jgi:hypothetical protein
MANISGLSNSDPSAILIEAVDAIKANEGDAAKRDQALRILKLLTVLTGFDLKILATAVKSLSKFTQITIDSITEELLLLQSFSGKDGKNALVSIDWESGELLGECDKYAWKYAH